MSKKMVTQKASLPSIPAKVPARQIAVILFVLIGLAISALIGAQRLSKLINPNANQDVQENESALLPDGWKFQEPTGEDERILFQAYKDISATTNGTNSSSITPSVTVLVSPLPEGVQAENYTEELTTAAQASLPSLEYTVNESSSSENLVVRRLQGTLEMGNEKVGFKQQIYIRNADVYTFTGLYPLDENSLASSEVEIIFDQILSELGL